MSASARCAVLRLIGEIDAATLLGFRTEADQLLCDETVHELIVDLSETTGIDWSGLALLLHLKMVTVENAVELLLRAVPAPIGAIFERAGLDHVFAFADR